MATACSAIRLRDVQGVVMFRTHPPRPTEYYLLIEPKPEGRAIGSFAGQPIAEFMVDADGAHYAYAGIAPRLASGRYDLDALRRDEWLVEPGLIYVLARTRQSAA